MLHFVINPRTINAPTKGQKMLSARSRNPSCVPCEHHLQNNLNPLALDCDLPLCRLSSPLHTLVLHVSPSNSRVTCSSHPNLYSRMPLDTTLFCYIAAWACWQHDTLTLFSICFSLLSVPHMIGKALAMFRVVSITHQY